MLATKYLVFDLEYAASRHGACKICEFGYVQTNERFEIIKQGNFIIDPYINRSDWDWFAVRKILTRKVSYYEKQPRFDEFYDDIKELIQESDYVFGHSLDGDAKALNDECQRYDLASIDFDFYDIKQFYKEYSNVKRDVSVTEILEKLGVKGDERTHDAEADAYNTMLELKTMLETLEMSLEELIIVCPNAKNKNENYEVESIMINRMIREEQFKEQITSEGNNTMNIRSKHRRHFLQFLDNVQPNNDVEKKLKDIKFSISINYEENHYKQMLNIVQLLCNLGATYVMKASTADIFVKYDAYNDDGTIKECSKLKYVTKAIINGSSTKIITFNEFLDMLGITEESLDNMPMVSFDCLYREDAVIKDRKTLSIINNKKQKIEKVKTNEDVVTLGDTFKDFFASLKIDDNK